MKKAQIEAAFGMNAGPGSVLLPVGLYFFRASDFVELELNGKVAHRRVSMIRLLCLDETTVKVIADGLVSWSFTPCRDFEPVDPKPHEALMHDPKPPTIQEMIRQAVSVEAMRNAAGEEFESEEEANDFTLEDEDLPVLTPHELAAMSPAEMEEAFGPSDADVALEKPGAAQRAPSSAPAPASAPAVGPVGQPVQASSPAVAKPSADGEGA